MPYSSLARHNIMELWLYDTCNFRCGYCGLVTSGDVRRVDQLEPYRDPEHIDRLLRFFREQRPGGRPWAVLLTGGEPLLMPNLDRFVLGLKEQGGTVGIYTNMSTPLEKCLSREAIDGLAYIECSYHPDWHLGHFDSEQFFAHVARAKELGVALLVRFVGAPQVLHLLPELEARCHALGVTFFPTTLFSPDYPRSYSAEERSRLAESMVGYSSLIQLEGGLRVEGRGCEAADRLFAARLHKGGDVTPCVSAGEPVLGNVFDNWLRPLAGPNRCFRQDQLCTCDIHFQQGVVEGADDGRSFAEIVAGRGPKLAGSYAAWKAEHGLQTSDRTWAGQGVTIIDSADLLRKAPAVRRGTAA